MKPVISIVGRENVGKSTLYNRLTRTRDAIVDDFAGVTRDRQIGEGREGDREYWVVDTGGYDHNKETGLRSKMHEQFQAAIKESDAIIFVVDGRDGLNMMDYEITQVLRSSDAMIFLAVNKAEGVDSDVAVAEFHALGIGESLFAISAQRGTGVQRMIASIVGSIGDDQTVSEPQSQDPRIAVLGKPNVGKSTLVNQLLGENRMIVFDQAGTTRDSVCTSFVDDGSRYSLIDTAGVRRKARVTEKIEKISIVRTLRTLHDAHVIILVLDAHSGITEQDSTLAGLVREHGRSMVLVVNKWDGLERHQKEQVGRGLRRGFPFLDSVTTLFISAKYGSGVAGVMPAVRNSYDSAMANLGTAKLNSVLRQAVEAQPPPRVGRQQIKLKYAHQGGKNPPTVVIHGNLVNKVPESYKRYLASSISKGFKLTGTRIQLAFRTSRNPYRPNPARTH